MSSALEGSPIKDFSDPSKGLVDYEVCGESGLKPVFWCPEDVLEWKIFSKGEEPDEICDIHNKVEVPDVTGKSVEEARAIFEELFIEATEVSEYNETFNQGVVFDQSPPPGSFLESLTGEKLSIILYVSKGEQTFEMPDLMGLKLKNAENILSALEVGIEEIVYEFSDFQPADYIFDQSPEPDSLISKSTGITLYISKGEDPEGIVPDITGLTEEEALTALTFAGFENVTVVLEESNEEIDLVFSQAPESGTAYEKVSEIVIIISQGVLIPDVTGMILEDAVIRLEDLGFSVSILPEGIMEGTVTDQSPINGEYGNYGSEVILTIDDGLIPEDPPAEDPPDGEPSGGEQV
jgi:serine/threonine-protein kinase